MSLSNVSLVAFHYRSYGTFCIYSKRLHNLLGGFTHYRNYRAKKHLEYWEECIDPSYGMVDLDPQVIMIPKPVYETMEELDRQYDETFKK
ncbi:hypothetical protein ACTGZW_07555, partial [Streptococcus suis]